MGHELGPPLACTGEPESPAIKLAGNPIDTNKPTLLGSYPSPGHHSGWLGRLHVIAACIDWLAGFSYDKLLL